MDPEQTFLRVHARVTGMLSQLLTPRIRTALEYVYLSIAVASFALLVVMHTNFVQQPGCSSQLTGLEISEAQLVQIKISSSGLWIRNTLEKNARDGQIDGHSIKMEKMPDDNGDGFQFSFGNLFSSWIASGAKRSKWNFKLWKSDKAFLERQMETGDDNMLRNSQDDTEGKDHSNEQHTEERQSGFLTSQRATVKATFFHFCNMCRTKFHCLWRKLKHFPRNAAWLSDIAGWRMDINNSKSVKTFYPGHVTSLIVQWLEKSSLANDPAYLYTTEKGYFLLPDGAKSRHNIRTVNVSIPAHHLCFGNRWQQVLINLFVGYDTILMNSVLSSPGPGYLYNFQTKEFFHLSFGPEPTDGPARLGDYFVTKCSVLLMSLFVFFTTTMSVSFTLRETQSRMLKFTVQLQHHARHHLPTFKLIFVHVIESLVFVPIMIGILFFLFEFYDDQLLAFLVLTLVWLCELFTMISVRTPISMQFFPRFFLLYFLVFHIYFFSYAYGFSYLAFSTTAAFMQHLILFFWNRYEVPALQRFMRSRSQLQQQAGVQITSSTILTSTLHIARVSMANPPITNNGVRSGNEPLPAPDPVEIAGNQQSAGDNSDPTEGTALPPESNMEQRGANPSSVFLNPFGTLLLWILGGASTDGLVSLFSMFRDMREQGNVYVDQPHNDNEPIQ